MSRTTLQTKAAGLQRGAEGAGHRLDGRVAVAVGGGARNDLGGPFAPRDDRPVGPAFEGLTRDLVFQSEVVDADPDAQVAVVVCASRNDPAAHITTAP